MGSCAGGADNDSVQEGVYLFKHGIDPYSGSTFRQVRTLHTFCAWFDVRPQSPLLLSLFSTVAPLNEITAPLLWTASDALAAWSLVHIWRARQNVVITSRDSLIAALYVTVEPRLTTTTHKTQVPLEPIYLSTISRAINIEFRERTLPPVPLAGMPQYVAL